MTNTKFEKLIDLYINEDIERAEQLFHEIVVEKSREIYESMMDEEGDMSGSLMAEVEADETAMEADEDFEDTEDMIAGDEDDMEDDMDDIDADLDDAEDDAELDDESDLELDMDDAEDSDEDLEDRVVDIEDKLEELMAEFEEMMADSKDEDEEEVEAEEDEEVMESIQLAAVKPVHGDDGAQKVSPVAKSKKIDSNGASAVTFSQGEEKGRAAPAVGTVKGDFKNVPAKNNFSEKGEKAPSPKKEEMKSASPVAESKRTTKRRV